MPLRAHRQRKAVQPLELTPPVQQLHNRRMNQPWCERWQREECKNQHNYVSDLQYGFYIQLLFVPVKKKKRRSQQEAKTLCFTEGCKQRAK